MLYIYKYDISRSTFHYAHGKFAGFRKKPVLFDGDASAFGRAGFDAINKPICYIYPTIYIVVCYHQNVYYETNLRLTVEIVNIQSTINKST